LKVTPTYEPAIIDTLKDLGCNFKEQFDIYLAITSSAKKIYQAGIADNQIDKNTPLCYREIVRKENLDPIIEKFKSGQ